MTTATGTKTITNTAAAGWKTIWTGKILNDSWMIRIEHAVAA
jgi:hypothetical protein